MYSLNFISKKSLYVCSTFAYSCVLYIHQLEIHLNVQVGGCVCMSLTETALLYVFCSLTAVLKVFVCACVLNSIICTLHLILLQ
jgi:hypothetical protein